MNKETGGVILAFAGFVFLVGAVKGTWQKAWKDLTTGTTAPATTDKTPTNSNGSLGNKSTNLPGSAPAPMAPHPDPQHTP